MSCTEIGLHKSVKKRKDIQRIHHQNFKIDIVKILNNLFAVNF